MQIQWVTLLKAESPVCTQPINGFIRHVAKRSSVQKFASILFLILGLWLGFPAETQPVSPWFSVFTPRNEFYVSPDGTGDGTSPETPMSVEEAIDSAEPGNLYWLLQGTFRGEYTFSADGTANNPIVFRAFSGHRVRFIGSLRLHGDYTWIWGLDISDPEPAVMADAVEIRAAGVRLINNHIHHKRSYTGVGAWNTGPGQVIYGNVIHHNGIDYLPDTPPPHNIYTQNNLEENGYKYFVHNIILQDPARCEVGCLNFNGYTEQGYISGFHVEENIFAGSRFLIGGFNVPADQNRVLHNVFYDMTVQFGYRRPTQVDFIGNQLIHATLATQWFWGAGETLYAQAAPNVYTDNAILASGIDLVRFRTSAYTDNTERREGAPRIQSTDMFDYNIYAEAFRADFFAAGKQADDIDFAQWQQETAAAGNAFDQHSRLVPLPTEPQVFVFPNAYEPARAHIAVYNWSDENEVELDLSSVVRPGERYAIYRAEDLYGQPILRADSLRVILPVNSGEFAALVVLKGL